MREILETEYKFKVVKNPIMTLKKLIRNPKILSTIVALVGILSLIIMNNKDVNFFFLQIEVNPLNVLLSVFGLFLIIVGYQILKWNIFFKNARLVEILIEDYFYFYNIAYITYSITINNQKFTFKSMEIVSKENFNLKKRDTIYCLIKSVYEIVHREKSREERLKLKAEDIGPKGILVGTVNKEKRIFIYPLTGIATSLITSEMKDSLNLTEQEYDKKYLPKDDYFVKYLKNDGTID